MEEKEHVNGEDNALVVGPPTIDVSLLRGRVPRYGSGGSVRRDPPADSQRFPKKIITYTGYVSQVLYVFFMFKYRLMCELCHSAMGIDHAH